MILFAMASLPPLGIYSLLVHFSIYGKVGQAFPCGEVCECYDQQQHFVADCSGRNLRFLPLRLPKETQYLDFSGNALSTLFPQIIAHLPRSLLVLDLSNNPLRCDDQTLRRLKSSVSVRDNCLEASLSAGFSNSEKSLLHRSKRAVTANGECKIGSSNCVKHICGGFEYWLPYATYWGCCQGKIHDLRKTYCSKIQGVQPCNHTMYNQSKCSNGHCVPENWKCNKMNDCQDGSDEVGCDQCKENDNFRCRNGRCVPQSVVCDAYNDCGDGSDETFCRTLNGGWCKTDEYRCPTDVCIPVSAVCDGSNDCADYSDEIGCKEREPNPGQDVCVEMLHSATDGRWRTGKCTIAHSSYVCEKVRTCHVLGAGRDCRGNFEKPKMTSFPREEILSVSYDSEVNVECKATGFPRPSVMLFINALRAYTIASARSMMAPYEANVTLVVKMTSEVECHVTNRLGSSVVRMRIVMKDGNSAFLKAVLRLKEFSFTAKLKDPMSQEFKMLADTLEKKMMQVYREVKDVRDVNVVSFSEGSVVADFILYTVKDTSSDLEGILDSAVKTRTFGEAVIDSFGKVKACPKEFFNVTWSFTFEGQYATQVCPRGAKGMSKRKCLENGVWGYPDYGQCTSQEFSQLNDKIDVMSNSSRPSNNQVTRVILELSLLTKPKKYDAVMAGDIKISTQILRKVVNYNEKFSNGRETETANIEGFLQTVSNLLDANNIRDFSQLQKTDKTATDLTKVTEDYGLQTAAGQKNTNDEYRVVKDNIAMEAKLVANDAQGPLMFPGNLVGLHLSPLWANSGKQCITLPKALFNKNSNLSANGTKVASFLFRTLDSFLTQESAYEIVGQQFEVESRVIASSVEPPAGKLAEPVVIVFGGFQDDHRKAVCVYWDYYLNSRGGGWSTDGCWLASRDSGTITCKCDHLTNFAILMDTSGISSGFLQTVSNLLDANNIRDFSQLQKTDKTATDLTKVTEDYGLQTAAGQKNTNDEYRVVKDNIAMEAKLVANDAQGPLMFPGNLVGLHLSPLWANSGKQCITLPKALFNKNSNLSANGTKVASFLFRTLDSFLTQESAYEIVGQQFEVESRVIASSVEPPAGKLAEPVVIVFGGFQDDHRKAVCVYWDYYLNSRGGGWSTDGCWLASRDSGTITCKCDHLTNFAILMDTSGISSQHSEHSKTLSYITLIGCCLSLLGIIITLALHFALWRILKSPKTVIHVNLCSTLLIANILLLVGSAATRYKILCTVVSVLLHYFFLSAILWMLAEGLQIYSAIVKVFDGEGKLKYFYILGWGVPLIIVLPCLVITRTVGYGENRTCWLSIRSGLIWTFIGPALTVVLINSIIFLLVLRAMMTSHKMIGASDKEKIKLGIKCSVVLIPLLGISWVFGVIAFDQDTVIFLYLFAVFNSLQGFFIFIFHCVLDQQVRAAIRIWRNKRQRTSYASAVDTTPKSKPNSNSLSTERLPRTGARMSDLTAQETGSFSNRECQTAHKKHKTNRV